MADAAEFFAKKKKGKKKAFKFNANKIDASTVTQTVHVDAPALSTDQEAGGGMAGLSISSPSNPSEGAPSGENDKGSGEQWDDEALAATFTRKTAAPSGGTTSELMDMKALNPKGTEQDNIAEKLRVEENKAKLAAAREGMEREAQRLKEEQEKKKEATSATAPRFAAAAAGGGGGGKWVPPHMRAGGAGTLPKIRMGAAGGSVFQKVDTQDENLFPDLASADAIIEQQQKHQQPLFKVVKKTPVGGGASWASKPKIAASKPKPKPKPKPEPPKKTVEPAAAPAAAAHAPPATPEKPNTITSTETSPVAATTPPDKVTKKPLGKKKKKKDLSTFKA